MKKNIDESKNLCSEQAVHAPTSRDVALLAGVSQSSVCRVFDSKWSERISPKLRQKVMAAADELGYSPNAIARSLTVNRSGIVGVIVSEDFNEFYYDLLRRITNELQKLDMRVMVFNAAPYKDIKQVFQKLAEYRVDGVIVTAAAISNMAEPFKLDRDVPMVLVNIYSSEPFCDTVITDNYAGSMQAASYLYDCGHRNFVFLSAENSLYYDVPDRKRGFMDFIAQKSDATCRHFAGNYSYHSGQAIAREILSQGMRPDCVFCSGTRMALGVMDVARYEYGLKIPEDLSVAGYDDFNVSYLDSYALTGVQQDSERMAEVAVELLQKAINGHQTEEPEIIQIPTRLEIRGSVRQAAQAAVDN